MKPLTPVKAIRKFCLDCAGGPKAIWECDSLGCVLRRFRLGTNPARQGIGNARNVDSVTKKAHSTTDFSEVTTGAGLTSRQEGALLFLEEFTEAHGYPPTFREIGHHVGLKSSATVYRWLVLLRAKGLIKWEDHSPRTVRLVREAN